MIANYHTHTPRCHHAGGSEREYIENAIKAGFCELGAKTIIGCGGHDPRDIVQPDSVERVKNLIENHKGLKIVDKLEFKSIKN